MNDYIKEDVIKNTVWLNVDNVAFLANSEVNKFSTYENNINSIKLNYNNDNRAIMLLINYNTELEKLYVYYDVFCLNYDVI